MAFGRENAATMALDDTLRRADYDTPLVARSNKVGKMGMAEIMKWAASSRPYFTPKVDQAIELPDDLLEIDMPDVEVELSPGLRVTYSPFDFLPDDFSDPDVTNFSLPSDSIFFYRRGVMSKTDSFENRESLLSVLREFPFVFVLQIDKGLPIPQNWISTMEILEDFFSQKFHFVCVNAKMPSSGMLYINGKLDSFFELEHTGSYIAHGDLLRDMLIERVNLSLDISKDRSCTRNQISLVMGGEAGDAIPDRADDDNGVPKPDLSSLPKADDRAIDGWLGNGTLGSREK